MTPDLINMRVATWAGWTNIQQSRRHQGRIVGHAPERYELMVIPDYVRSNAAMDLLGVLVERGYKVDVQSDGPQWSMVLQHPDMKRAICSLRDTIPAAICHAIIELVEREGK